MLTEALPLPIELGARACAHCGTRVPEGRLEGAVSFCCDGCEVVYGALRAGGLEAYYDIRTQCDAPARPIPSVEDRFDAFDDPAFLERHASLRGDGTRSVRLMLDGVHCAACLWLVERAPLITPGLLEARLDLQRATAELVWEPERTRLSVVARALAKLGYVPHPLQHSARRQQRARERRALLVRIGVAGAIAGNVMLLSFALYGGAGTEGDPGFATLFRWASLLLALPSVTWAALPFHRGALASVLTRTPHLDLPISMGVIAGGLWGAVSTLRGEGELYFDTLTTLVFLLLVGRWLTLGHQRSAEDAADRVHALAPSTAWRREPDGRLTSVPTAALVLGDLIEVRAGEQIPVDAVIVEGASHVDTAWLTGESRHQAVGEGQAVHAGTLNVRAPLVARVTKTGEATRLGQLVVAMQAAAAKRAPMVLMADRLTARFVAVVLAAAALTFALWWPAGPDLALQHAVALLVVTCPCALGMATPLAVTAALGQAARRGIYIKHGEALERLARPGLFVFDKTGTLTRGELRLLRWHGAAELRGAVGALEGASTHVIARTLSAALSESPAARVTEVHSVPGAGITGVVAGQRLVVGSPRFVLAQAAAVSEDWSCMSALEAQITSVAEAGSTPVLIAVDGRVSALAELGDPLHEDARESLLALRGLGYRLAVLSGDHPAVVARIVAELGLDLELARGDVGPEEKLAFVEHATKASEVFMVGDGVNDAAALSAASVGVAVQGGAEASLAAADVFLARPGLGPIVELVRGARAAHGVIRRGLGFSLLYNVMGAALAIAGVLGPLLAAILMPISSLTVVSHAFRWRAFPGDPA